MKIGKKLNIVIISIIAALLLSTVVTLINLSNIEKNVDEALNDKVEKIRIVDEIRVNIGMQGLYVRALMISNTRENQDLFQQYANQLNDAIAEFQHFQVRKDVTEQLEVIQTHNDLFNQNYTKLLDAVNKDDLQLAEEILVNELKVSNLKILEASNIILEIQNGLLDEINEETTSSVNLSSTVSIVLLVVSLILGLFMIIFVNRSITKPLGHVMEAANLIAKGDLTGQDLHVQSKDEIGQLGTLFNEMKTTLKTLITNIQVNAISLNTASQELSASTEEVSASGEEITQQVAMAADIAISSASASTESSAAMQETAAGVQTIATASQVLQQVSQETSTAALQGKEIIDNAQHQMNTIAVSTATVNEVVVRLAKQTAEIESISKVITDITDQTNLLALNASIEAARAGEHGKGFAVVADEVKKLANESKSSAEAINQLTVVIQKDTAEVQKAVNNAMTSVNDGLTVIKEAGTSFENILTDVDKMSSQIQEVSATAEELSASAEQVSGSIHEIASDSVVASEGLSTIAAAMEEQNATMNDVNEISLNLTEKAEDLQKQANQFKI